MLLVSRINLVYLKGSKFYWLKLTLSRIKKELAQFYASNFGFLICKIDDSADFSPIGYISSRLKEKLFIPTRHDHGEGNVPIWDHKIYLVGVSDSSVVSLGDITFAKAKIAHASTNQVTNSTHYLISSDFKLYQIPFIWFNSS